MQVVQSSSDPHRDRMPFIQRAFATVIDFSWGALGGRTTSMTCGWMSLRAARSTLADMSIRREHGRTSFIDVVEGEFVGNSTGAR